MIEIENLRKIRNEIQHIEDNKSEIHDFVIAALNQVKPLEKAKTLTGLSVSKLSRALTGQGFNDKDLFACFLALSKGL